MAYTVIQWMALFLPVFSFQESYFVLPFVHPTLCKEGNGEISGCMYCLKKQHHLVSQSCPSSMAQTKCLPVVWFQLSTMQSAAHVHVHNSLLWCSSPHHLDSPFQTHPHQCRHHAVSHTVEPTLMTASGCVPSRCSSQRVHHKHQRNTCIIDNQQISRSGMECGRDTLSNRPQKPKLSQELKGSAIRQLWVRTCWGHWVHPATWVLLFWWRCHTIIPLNVAATGASGVSDTGQIPLDWALWMPAVHNRKAVCHTCTTIMEPTLIVILFLLLLIQLYTLI